MNLINPEQILFEEISAMIERAKRTIYTQANRESVLLFWNIGRRVNDAEYWTALPPKAEFEQKIKTILSETRERLARRNLLLSGMKQNEYI